MTSIAKKALSSLSGRSLAEQTGAYGYWRIGGEAAESSGDSDPATDSGPVQELQPAVYVYYLPAYEHLAIERGESCWPHKIGMTTTNAEARIGEQVGTAIPERPIIALVHETSNPGLLERVVHAVLELRGRRTVGAVGAEWFETNIEEIREIIGFTDPR